MQARRSHKEVARAIEENTRSQRTEEEKTGGQRGRESHQADLEKRQGRDDERTSAAAVMTWSRSRNVEGPCSGRQRLAGDWSRQRGV